MCIYSYVNIYVYMTINIISIRPYMIKYTCMYNHIYDYKYIHSQKLL